MSNGRVWTFDELETRLCAHEDALRARDRRLGLPFLGLLGAAALLVGVAAFEVPAPMTVLRAAAAAVLAGLAALAAYVLATTRRFRQRYAVLCPHCGCSLAALREWMELSSDGAGAAPPLRCPDCEEVVARQAA